jgi:N-acetylmuramoyl-L-alanine amidase/uncharacterized protein YgiM (DUF1202 family)
MIKKILSLSLTTVFFISISLNSYSIAQTLRYVVISPVANIRMAPSLNSDVVHIVTQESEFLIISEVNDSEQKLWYKIQISSNLDGFIASWVIDSIKTLEKEIPVSDKTIIIDAGVRIRVSPSLSSKINVVVQKTVEKKVVSEIKDNENRSWYKIPMNDGSDGWVASWVVTVKTVKEDKKSASDKLIVIEENVNIRKGPGVEFDTVSTITSYMEVRGIYEAQDSNNDTWFMIRLPNNVEGWVASWVVEVKKYSDEKTPVSNRIAIIEPIVNLREGPSIQAKIVRTIQVKSEYPIVSQGNDINGKLWYELKLEGSFTGWVASWVVTVKSTEARNETKEALNIRKGPGTDFEKIGEAAAMIPIQIEGSAYTDSKESWFLVALAQQKGWILGSLLTISKNPIQLDTKLIGSSFNIAPNNEVNVHQGPDTGFPVSTTINQKSGAFTIIGMSNNLQNESWAQIKNSSNVRGWLLTKNITQTSQKPQTSQNKITAVSWSKNNQNTTLTLTFSESASYLFDTITLQDPPRYVFDLPDTLLFQSEFKEQVNENGIISIRATQFSINPNIVRVVVEMEKDLKYLSKIDTKALVFDFSDYSNYEGPKLIINGIELENHLLLRNHQNQLYLPLFLFANMSNSVLSWDSQKKEAVLLLNKKEYRFKSDTKYVFIKASDRQARIELDHTIASIDQVMHLALNDFSKIFQTTLSKDDNNYYLDNTLIELSHSKQNQSLVYVFHFALPAKCVPNVNQKIVSLSFHNATLANFIKIPDNPDLDKINSQPRNATQASKTDIIFNLNQYASFETAMLEEGHQFVFTLKPKSGKGIAGKTIIIDPGHGAFSEDGYYDVGAIGPTGLLESVVNLKISLNLKDMLEKAGAKVILTRDQEQNKTSLKLQERIEMANKSGADLYLSIHNNASLSPDAKGSEIYYFRDEDKLLSEWILNSLISSTGLNNRGSKQRGFAVTKNVTTMPSLLLECAFLSNPEEEKMLQSDTFLNLIAEGIFNGIKAWFDSN